MKIFNNKAFIITAGFLGFLALVMLGAGLAHVQFKPAEAFPLAAAGGFGGLLNNLQLSNLLTQLIFITLAVYLVLTVIVLLHKDLRKTLLRKLVQFLPLVILVIVITSLASGDEEETAAEPTPQAAVATAQGVPEMDLLEAVGQPLPAEIPDQIDPPSWVGYLVSALVVFGAGYWLWTYLGRREEGPLHEIADIAISALEDLESGRDLQDAIQRCYAQMTDAVRRKRGLSRQISMTPEEFASWLVRAGLPREPLLRLTRLFEKVRYGGKATTTRDAAEAADCLRAIVNAVGDQSS